MFLRWYPSWYFCYNIVYIGCFNFKIEDKYVLNINCSLWDKISDINKSFEYIKEEVKNNYKLELISFDDAYNYYYKYCNKKSYKFIVSKHYFEKYYKIHQYF